MGKGNNTTTTTNSNSSTSAPDAQAAGVYRDILNRAQGVAATPYQAYTGNLTADTNSQQNLGTSTVNSASGYADPYIARAAELAGASSKPVNANDIFQYYDPYQQKVIDATTSQLTHDFGQQQAQLQGNQIAQGALGGNATGVAKGVLAGQQARTLASTTAGLESQGFNTALQAAQRQQQTGLSGANAMANYGISGQGAALQAGQAQYGLGTQQQATEQARINALYGQYAQAQAYPYQQTQWLAGVGTGVGSNLGGTSSSTGTGTSTAPAPNQTAQLLGLGLSAASMLPLSDRDAKRNIERIGAMNDGTPIYRFQYKGDDQWHIGPMAQDVERRNPDAVKQGVDGYKHVDMHEAAEGSVERAAGGGVGGGGMPWSEGAGWIPQVSGIHAGSGAPRGGSGGSGGGGGGGQGQQPAFDPQKLAGGLSGAVKGVSGLFGGNADTSATGDFYGDSSVGGAPLSGYEGVAPAPSSQSYGYFATGGGVAGYARGGTPFHGDDPAWASRPDMVSDGGFNEIDANAGISDGGFNEIDAEANAPAAPLQHQLSFEQRTFPVQEAIEAGNFDPQGANSTDFTGSPGMTASNGKVPIPRPRPEGMAPVVAEDDEEAPAPRGVAGRTGVAPKGGVMAFAPEGEDGSYDQLPDAIRRPEEEKGWFGTPMLSKNARAGMLAAGLGMMASRSPFLGTAVGEGGLTGVAAYGAGEERDRQTVIEAQKLSREARKDKFAQTHQTNTLAETMRHNKATEDKERTTAFKPTWGVVDEDPITGRKIYGWIDPNNKTTSRPAAKEGDRATIPRAAVGDDYMKELEDRNPEMARTVKAVANYQASLTSLSQRGGMREKVLEHVMRYNPEYDQTQFGGKQQAVKMFSAGPEGRAVRALNVSIDHLDTLQEAANALKNGQLPILNKAVNYYREKTGSPLTTNFDSIKQVVSAEIAKAVVGGQTALHDRDDMARRASNSQSPEMLSGIITQFHKLMSGQMKGLRRAYTATTKLKNFDDFLEPRTKKLMEENSHHGDDSGGEAGAKTGASGALPEGRTGTKNGRPVVVKGGKLIYSDTGEPAQ